MQAKGWMAGRVVFFSMTLAIAAGCREQADSAGSFVEDMGDENRPLTPVAVRSYSDEFSGSAELKVLGSPDGDAEEAAQGDAASGDFADIQRTVATYNEIVAEQAWDDLSPFFVERQRPAVTAALELNAKVKTKLDALRAAVEAKAPEAVEKVDRLAAKAEAFSQIVVTNLESTGEGMAAGSWAPTSGDPVPPGMNEIKFERIDDEWFIDWPALDMVTAMAPALDAMLTMFDMLAQQINDGTVDAAAVVTQIDTMLAGFSAGEAPAEEGGAQPDDDQQEPEEGDAPDEDDGSSGGVGG